MSTAIEEPKATPTNGLKWAWASFVLDKVESLVLVQIVFFDKKQFGVDFDWGVLEIYFLITTLMSIGQLVGIVLVIRGQFRLGGYFQIVSSVGQVMKLDGILGVIGGNKALKFARACQSGAC